ncbi:hypothetical protein [Clavibacter tessellarius]|uniref:hypothetical protein n=1 Tax=Clavibacter tessellarius TaxID=31965 RepID=UPI003246111F
MFFVLSGFILAYNYSGLSGTAERRAFYVNRIARIYPVVLLSSRSERSGSHSPSPTAIGGICWSGTPYRASTLSPS